MDIQITRRDLVLSLLLVGGFLGWVAYAQYDNRVMQRELQQLAEAHIDDWFEGYPEPVERQDFDYLSIVDSEKAFTLFGRGWGVVHFYIKDKADADFKTFKGLEYFYVRENGVWQLQDSAGCGAYEHHLRAFDEFMKLGVHVPGKVFDRALGIKSDTLEHLDASQAAAHAS